MSLTIGIVGLPNVGKSTLFNALTRSAVLAANYPFATIEPNLGRVPLPDTRLDRLAEIYSSENVIPAFVDFVDIAGIVRGAAEGEGMGNQFLSHIRQANAICHVVRGFTDDDVIHVHGTVDPLADREIIETELILADLQTLDKALPRLQTQAKKNVDQRPLAQEAEKAREILDQGRTIWSAQGQCDVALLQELHLMTAKPFLYVINADESLLKDTVRQKELRERLAPARVIFLDAQTEAELVSLEAEEAAEFLREIGQEEPGLDAVARAGFATLGLQTYLTAGPKESRAWTIKEGSTAPEAAGVIHTDFQRGFIKAEIVSFADLDQAGSLQAARAQGKIRMEGKDYVMADGDVVEFRFNV